MTNLRVAGDPTPRRGSKLWHARAPLGRAAWDGWFFIAIFPDGTWCKVHLFSGGKPHCLSAVEGLDGPPQELALIGNLDAIHRRGGSIDPLETDDTTMRGRDVTFSFGDETEVRARGIRATVTPGEPFYWVRVPRVLTYFTCTGAARVTIDGVTREALGLMEHAWGGRTRLDIARLGPRRWQWDVLSLGKGQSFSGLAIGPIGVVNRLRVRVLEWSDTTPCFPARWSGRVRSHGATLEYEARAVTPVAPEVAGGGFLGFTWDGQLRGARVSGAGFTEYRA